ncbi:hypothetical protein L2E82_12316 [Cichorium intybus]|uniref:Uncharacterized protein n=1 Tax=Cichorium intybus TaxID=13427 RepID=A0ACB9GGZ8_CICIN|nr:hypothetical protein L2E82_12316 [Cichorium intybus]
MRRHHRWKHQFPSHLRRRHHTRYPNAYVAAFINHHVKFAADLFFSLIDETTADFFSVIYPFTAITDTNFTGPAFAHDIEDLEYPVFEIKQKFSNQYREFQS